MSEKEFFPTRQVMEQTGLSKDTLRYYERIGILENVARGANNYRQYSKEDVEWLILVKYLRSIGVGTKDLIGGQNTSVKARLAYLEDYQVKIEQEIERLQQINMIVKQKIHFLEKM